MIAELLPFGEENAIRGRDLCYKLGIPARALTAAVEKERRNGQPICATTDSANPGYYLAPDQQAMLAYCGRLNHRKNEIARTIAACKKCAEKLPEAAPTADP